MRMKSRHVALLLLGALGIAALWWVLRDEDPAPEQAPAERAVVWASVVGHVERQGARSVGVRVWLEQGGERRVAETDASGAFYFGELSAGRVALGLSGNRPGSVLTLELEEGEGRSGVVLEPELPAILKGEVLLDGAPGEARVQLFYDEEERAAWEGRSGVDGRFTFAGLRPGPWRVRALAREHAPVTSGVFGLGSGEQVDMGTLSLTWGAVVEGRVVNASGEGISQARVQVLEGARGEVGGRTDAEGRFGLDGLEGPLVRLEVSARGYRSERREHVAEAGDRIQVEVTLEPVEDVVIRLRGPDDEPVPGARVVLEAGGDTFETTSTEGDALFAGVRGGPHQAWAEHPSLGRSETEMVWAGETGVVRFGLDTGWVVEVSSGGSPVERFTLRVSTERGEGIAERVVEDAEGRAQVRLEPGRYVGEVLAEGYRSAEISVREVGLGDREVVRVELSGGGVVYGQVVDAESGAGLSGVQLWRGVAKSSTVVSDESGRFEVLGFGDEPESLTAQVEGYHVRRISGFTLAEGERREVLVALTPLEGDEEAGTEYAGVGMQLEVDAGALRIREVFDGAPSAEAGLQAGDRIVAVDDVPVEGQKAVQVSEWIRGEPGEVVRLRIERDGVEQEVEVVRDEVVRQ